MNHPKENTTCNRILREQPFRFSSNPSTHTQAYHSSGRGISYFNMLIQLPSPTYEQVHELIQQNYPTHGCPRLESYHNFFDVVNRLDRKSAWRVLDLVNGVHVYGEVKQQVPGGEQQQGHGASTSATATATAAVPASFTTASVSQDDNANTGTAGRLPTVTYTVRNTSEGHVAVLSGLPSTGVQPAVLAEVMGAASQIVGGLHKLVSLILTMAKARQ